MKNNRDEEIYYSTQNSSKPKPSNKTGRNEVIFERNHLLNHDKAQCSALKDHKFDSSKKKYFNNSSELIPKKIYRNVGEHCLFKDVEHSQSIKSVCITSNTDTNYINEEDNITISNENNKYTQKLLNNGRNTTKTTIKESFTNKTNNNKNANMLTSNPKIYEDKTTYCRPILNYYNQQFLYKTMERNTKLKNLVKTLTMARQREREKVNWNNFINELKNRHRYGQEDDLFEEYVTPEIINDDDNTILSWQKSKLCRNVLRDFYGPYDTLQPNRIHEQHQEPQQNIHYLPCNTNSYCYSTSSMGRLIILKRDQEKYKLLKCKTEEAEKISNCEVDAYDLTYKSCVSNLHDNKDIGINFKNIKSTLVQVDNKVIAPIIENLKKDKAVSNRESFSTESNETNMVDKRNYIKLENINNSSLVNIENKLEYLVEAINSFIIQIKSQKRSNSDLKCKTVPYKNAEKINGKLNMTKSDSLGMKVKENKVLSEEAVSNSGSTLSTANASPSDTYNSINKILKDIETYSKVDYQNEHKNKLNKPCCSVQISIEVPTKDCCTEVTKSLSKQKSGDEVTTMEEIIIPETSSIQEKMLPIQSMTIAVNTDPLSLLALLRFSTETIKRLMSYLPNFDYVSYLSALGFLQTWRTTENRYICKICGVAFDSPTKLSDHIYGHNLGKTRDCCVCRHDLERTRKSLFSCQYCGQHFTRSYCCELHQQSCAKRLGKCHNAASSLMLLR